MTRHLRNSLLSIALAGIFAAATAQEVARNPKADLLKQPQVMQGQATFQQNCAACHGTHATGGVGPNLVASALVRHDTKGDLVYPVVHNGRLEKGMPSFPALSTAQVGDIAAFLHARIEAFTRASALGGSAFSGQLAVGDAAAGKVYFTAHCSNCHNPTGDFAGIAKKHDPAELESLMLAPKAGPQTGKLTLADGQTIHGTVLHADDFSYTLRDANGNVRTVDAGRGVHLTIDRPLQAHDELLKIYTNKDIHDVFAYLETLQ